jgi:hypothetical protein
MTHTIDKIPLDEGSARRRHLYLKTQDTHNRQTDRHPCHRRVSNPQSKQASGCLDLRLRLRGSVSISQNKYFIKAFLKRSRTLWDTRERERERERQSEARNLKTMSILKVIQSRW